MDYLLQQWDKLHYSLKMLETSNVRNLAQRIDSTEAHAKTFHEMLVEHYKEYKRLQEG